MSNLLPLHCTHTHGMHCENRRSLTTASCCLAFSFFLFLISCVKSTHTINIIVSIKEISILRKMMAKRQTQEEVIDKVKQRENSVIEVNLYTPSYCLLQRSGATLMHARKYLQIGVVYCSQTVRALGKAGNGTVQTCCHFSVHITA